MTSNTSGFTPSRRTLVKGAAWSVPVVAIAAPAHAVGCSVDPTPCLEECLDFATVGDSYKVSNKDLYYVSFRFTNTCGQGTTPPPGPVCLTMRNNSPVSLMDPCNRDEVATLCFTMPAPGDSVVIPHAYYYATNLAQEVTFLYNGEPIGSVDTGGKVNNQLPGPACPNGTGAEENAASLESEGDEVLKSDVEEPVVETESAPAVQAPTESAPAGTESAPAEAEAPAAEPAGAVDATPPATQGENG